MTSAGESVRLNFQEKVTTVASKTISHSPRALRFPGLKFQLTAMVCQATGGPCNYIGKSMLETHDGWMITEEEWQSMAGNFKATLDKFEVPEAEQQELFAIVESTKGDIVVSELEPE